VASSGGIDGRGDRNIGPVGQCPGSLGTVPDDQISALENILRDLIEHVLSAKYGADWLSHLKVDEGRQAEWARRRDEEAKRRPGVSVDQRLLSYSDFTDLATIIDRHWDDGLVGCFRNKKRILLDMGRLGDTAIQDLMPGRWSFPGNRTWCQV
jgi:hypothetical protein